MKIKQETSESSQSTGIISYSIILFAALACHFPLFLSDALIWDGKMVAHWAALGRIDWFARWFGEVGVPFWTFLHGVFSIFPDPALAHRIIGFGCLIGIGVIVYEISVLLKVFSALESLLLGVFIVTSPCCQLWGQPAIFQYVFCPLLLLLGGLVTLRYQVKSGGIPWHVRLFVHALFLLSFVVLTMLIYYQAILLLIVVVAWNQNAVKSGFKLCQVLVKKLDFILIPILFYFFQSNFWKPSGAYANYNIPELSMPQIFETFSYAIKNGAWNLFKDAFDIVPDGVLGYGVTFICLLMISRWLVRCNFPVSCLKGSEWKILAFALLLFFLAVFPFALIGRQFYTHGWGTRYSINLMIPLGLLLVLLFRWLVGKEQINILRFGLPCLLLMVFGFSYVQWKAYASWQTLACKEKSIVLHFQSQPNYKDYSVLTIVDDYEISETIEHYPTVVWTYLFAQDKMPPDKLAFEQISNALHYSFGDAPKSIDILYTKEQCAEIIIKTTVDYSLKDIIINDRQAILKVSKGAGTGSRLSIAGGYWLRKFFLPHQLSSYLLNLTTVEFITRG